MPSKIRKWFSEIGEKMKTSVRMKNEAIFYILALILIVFLAIFVRSSSIFRDPPLLKAFDPYMQYLTTDYLVHHSLYDFFHWHSYMSWYPQGINRFDLRPGLIFSTGALYEVLTFFGIPTTVYDVCYYWPALMGGATVIVMFFLGKEVMDSKTGLLAAFFLAFSSGHIQRTILGFYDNETIGVFAVLMTFLFFLKSVKTGKVYHGIIAGISLGYLALSWGAYTYGMLLLPLICLIMILSGKYTSRLLIAYISTIGTANLIFIVNPGYDPTTIFKSMDVGVSTLFLGFMILYHIFDSQKTKNPKLYDTVWKIIKWGTVPAIIVFGLIFWFAPNILPFDLTSRGATILNPTIRQSNHLAASVGEQQPAPWSVFYFNSLIPVILTPLGVYYAVKRGREEDVLMLIFVITLLYFTGSMIRIILILAPALALIGAYGLSFVMKFFGSLIKKKPTITRRRKRQLRKTLGTAEGIAVFALIGFMFFAQVNVATTTSVNQLSYAEIEPGGQFSDWQEALSFMRENMNSSTVVASWWDYGYWLTVDGNVTTVADGATTNYTRLGELGMAFMQTNEIYSAKVFQDLGANYVLVYFGHLLSGLGGDEGKWPWMLRICNDVTATLKANGMEEPNWYGGPSHPVSTVFDEAQYVNDTSGLYRNAWFNSTLIKLMFDNEPTTTDAATTQMGYYFAENIAGDSANNIAQLKDDYGNTWASHIPTNGAYNLSCFVPYFYSSNHLIKIYKIDYTALDSSFQLINPSLTTNGIAHVDVQNTGTRNITLSSININGISYSNMTVQDGSQIVPAGATRTVWVDTNQLGQTWAQNQYYNITVGATAAAYGGSTYQFTNSTTGNLVVATPKYSINIDRNNSVIQEVDTPSPHLEVHLNVTNTGDDTVKLKDTYQMNGISYNISTDLNPNLLIKPGQTQELDLNQTVEGSPGNIYNINLGTEENASDSIQMTVNTPGYKLSILPQNRVVVNEELINSTQNPVRKLIPINYDSSVLYNNGSLTMTVENTGSKILGLQTLSINGQSIAFTPQNDQYFLNPGQETKIFANVTGIETNNQYTATITATGQSGQTVASDTGVLIPITTGSALDILTGTNETQILTNETAIIAVKNVGTDPITLSSFTLNGTTQSLSNAQVLYGSKTLNTFDICKLAINLTTGIKLNQSNTIDLGVTAGSAYQEKTVNAIVPSNDAFEIVTNSTSWISVSSDKLQLGILGTGLNNMSIDTFQINGTYIPANSSDMSFSSGQNVITYASTNTVQVKNLASLITVPLVSGDTYQITVTMDQGPIQTYTITAT